MLSKQARVIGFTCGSYDLLHAGHVMALKWAYHNCTRLIAGLQLDPSIDRSGKNRPVQTLEERYIQLNACRYVHEIWMYSTEAELYEFLRKNERGIAVRFLGEDWRDKPYTGYDLGMSVMFSPRKHSYSSSSLRERIIAAGSSSRRQSGGA